MIKDRQFLHLIEHANKSFNGWDFSYISDTGRSASSLLSWSYGSMVVSLLEDSHALLDMGTGGGEFLSKLSPFPKMVCATEGYLPNLPIAKKMLEPLGINVVGISVDDHLPFENGQFDLIINKHESFVAKEVRRIIKDNGIFLTQQVGGSDCLEINKMFEEPLNKEFLTWNLEKAKKDLINNGFKLVECKEEFPIQRFYDIGALVYYLQAIPWQIPNFKMENNIEKLYEIHQIIVEKGYFETTQSRFYLKVTAI